jgi:hypothetical protein
MLTAARSACGAKLSLAGPPGRTEKAKRCCETCPCRGRRRDQERMGGAGMLARHSANRAEKKCAVHWRQHRAWSQFCCARNLNAGNCEVPIVVANVLPEAQEPQTVQNACSSLLPIHPSRPRIARGVLPVKQALQQRASFQSPCNSASRRRRQQVQRFPGWARVARRGGHVMQRAEVSWAPTAGVESHRTEISARCFIST